MLINDFIRKFSNHPILFIGTGMSLRYLKNSFNWNDLLRKISNDISGNTEHYLDLKNKVYNHQTKSYNLPKLSSLLEEELDDVAKEDMDGKFSQVNQVYYPTMEKGIQTSRLKIYISQILNELDYKTEMGQELSEFKKARKNIGSVITTNYDTLIEDVFKFKPLIGNNILLSNPYGSIYKIHGCVDKPNEIIITENDYKDFEIKYDLIRAQLLSLFIHNPVVFLGYSISDNNIRKILETIFSYVNHTDELSSKIRDNFLLVEYDKDSSNKNVVEHDITIKDTSIRINKLATDDYQSLYKSISDLRLPISAMDIRKVQTIVGDIYRGGRPENSVKVRITEDLDKLDNSDTVLVIGSEKTISYEFRTISEMMIDYFSIIDENNEQMLEIIDKHIIQSNQYFPIFAFSKINTSILRESELKNNQENKIKFVMNKLKEVNKKEYSTIKKVLQEDSLSVQNKEDTIIWNVLEKNIDLDDFKQFLLEFEETGLNNENEPLKSTRYRKLLCIYDFCKYSEYSYSGDAINI